MGLEYPPDRLRVFVVDDASTDDTPDVVRAKAAQYDDRIVHLRREQGGQGKAHTLNHGIRLRAGRRLDAGAAHHGRRRHLPARLPAPDDPAPGRPAGRRRHRVHPRGQRPAGHVARFIGYEYVTAQAAARRAQNVMGAMACLAGGAQLHSRENLEARRRPGGHLARWPRTRTPPSSRS